MPTPTWTPTPTATRTPTPTPTSNSSDADGDTIADSVDPDDDNDGCTDVAEEATTPGSQSTGGLRDPLSFWDFMDVPAGSPATRDKTVIIGDIGAVVARFGAFRDPPPDAQEAFVEALTPPPAAPQYHAAYDRGGSIPGQNLWNLLPPDGSIGISDIGAAVAQFGHTCA